MQGLQARDDSDDDEAPMCPLCGGTPCDWDAFGRDIVKEVENQYSSEIETTESKTLRHSSYKLFVYTKYGFLGKGNRIAIAACVKNRIRDKWPDNKESIFYFN